MEDGQCKQREPSAETPRATMDENSLESALLHLVSHNAVYHIPRQGAGIGLVQQIRCGTTGIIKNEHIQSHLLKIGQKLHGGVVRVEDVNTATSAHMLALVYALGSTRRKVKRSNARVLPGRVRKVTVFSESAEVVQAANYHVEHGHKSRQVVINYHNSILIQRLIDQVHNLSHLGVEVAITVSSGVDEAGERARVLARQKASHLPRRHRSLRLAQMGLVRKQEQTVGVQGTFELVFRPKVVFPDMEQHEATKNNV